MHRFGTHAKKSIVAKAIFFLLKKIMEFLQTQWSSSEKARFVLMSQLPTVQRSKWSYWQLAINIAMVAMMKSSNGGGISTSER